MAVVPYTVKWNILFVTTFSSLAILTSNAQSHTCPMPSNLDAPSVAYNSITFRWDATKYIPNPLHCTCMSAGNYGETCSPSNTPKVCSVGVAGYTRTQSSLGVYTNYTMCVQTQCSNTNFSTAVCRTVRTSPVAPSQPYQIFSQKHTPYSLDVSWRFPTSLNGPLDGYRVRWCLTSSCVPSQQVLRGHNVRTFRVTGLQPYRQYNFYVSGFNVDPYSGQTLYGSEASFNEYTLPTYPSEPSLSFTKVSTSQVNIVVGVPKYTNGPVNGYVLTWCPKLRCYGDYVNTREIIQSNAGTQSITGLQPWTEYVFTVKAFNIVPTDSERAYSEEVKGSVVPTPFSPSGPHNFKATPLSATAMKLTWDLPPRYDITPSHFRLFWCTTGDKNCFNTDVGNVREATISPLAPYTEYRFMIKALVQFTSPWLNSAVSSASARTWPSDPSRPIDLQVVRTRATAVDVSWKAPMDPAGPTAGYRVRICPELGTCPAIGLVSRYKTLKKEANNHSFYGLEPYAKYEVQVKAFNNLPDEKTAEGDVAVVSVSTTPSEPSEPTNLTVETISSTALLVTWQPPSHKNGPVKGYNVTWWKTGYNLTHGLEDATSARSNLVEGEATSLLISNLLPYTTYAVQVSRVNVDGNTTLEGAGAHGEGITDPEPSPPPADVTLVAVKINDTTSRLTSSWSPPNATVDPPIEGYQLRVCSIQNTSACWDGNTTAEQRSYVIEAAANFEDYIASVYAYVLNHGRVVVGQSASATVSTASPEIPIIAHVNATAVNATSIYVEWERADSVNDLEMLYNATVQSSYGSEVSQLFVSEPKAVFAELQAWTSYTVQVSACVKRGSKLQCGTATAVVVRTSPTEPSMPTSVHTSTNGTAIHVTWDEPLHPNGPLMGYNVTWWLNNDTQMSSDDPEASHKSTVFLEGAVGSYVIGELHSAASYTIEVRRINRNNSTVFAGVPVRVEASTTPNSYPPPQGANYTIHRVNASHFEINLTWQAPRTSASADIEQYEVFIQRIEEGKPPVVFTANPLRPGYLFEVANINPFTEYIVQIRAYVRFGNTVVKGEAAEIRINVDAKLLLIVFNVQVNASADGVALVSWNSSLGADVQSSNTTMYVVNLVSTETGEEIEGTVVRSLQATFTGLRLTANYTARVTACDFRGHIRKCGDVSETRFQTPKEDVTPRPTDVSVVAVNSTALKVTWQMPTHSHGVDVTECRILWWPSMTDSASHSAEDVHTRIHFAKGNETTFVITGLEAYKSYDIEIVVFYVEDTVIKNVSVISKSTTAPKPFAPPSKVTFAISGDVDELTRVSISWQQPPKLAGPPLLGYYVDVCPIMTSSKSPTGALCKRHNTTSTNFVTVLEGLNRFEAYTVFVSAYTTHQGVAIVGNTEKTFVTIDPTPKLTIDALQVEAITNDSLRISWTGVDLSASRWRALYRVKVILKTTGDQVFEKEVSTTEVVFTDFKKEEYSIQIEACIVRGGVQNCGKPNAASFSRSALVQDKHQVTIQTINSTAIAVTLNLQGATEPHLDGFKISWAPSKQHPNDTSHGKSSTVLLPSNATGFIIANLDSFKVYDIRVTKVYSDGISHWETVATRSETVTDPKPFPKPSGVTYKSSTSGGKSSLVLSWDAPTTSSETPTEGYIVSICPRDELQETTGGCQTYNTSASSLQVEVSDLSSFSEYAVEITAYATINGRVVKGESIRKVVVTSPPPIPVIENPLVYNSVEGTSVNISWARPHSLTGYEVAYEVVLIEEASGLVLSKQEVNISETTLKALEPSTEYTVTITACLLRGTQRKCGNTTTLLFKAASKDIPKEPINMHIKAVNSSALLVTWRPPSSNDTPVEGYVLTWWKENETFPEEVSTETKSLPADMTSFVISGLEANTTYHVNVSRLYQGSRTRQADTEVTSASTQPDPYLKPQGLRAEYMSNSSEVTVTWDAFPVRTEDSPVRGYTVNLCVIVENDTREDLQDCDQREVSAGIEKVVFTRVNSLSDYRVEVKAMVSQPDNGTEEGQPGFVRFHTPGPPVPDLRQTLRVDINATSAKLFWRRPVGFDEYEVFYYVSVSSASSQLKVEKTTNLTEQIFEGLEPGTNYTADVATCLVRRKRWHCAGNTTIQFKTLPVGFQGEVRNFTAEAVSGTAVQLSWNAPGVRDALKDYRLSSWLYDTNHTRKAHSNVSTVPFYKTSAVIDRLEPYTTYAIEVTAEYEVGDVTWHGSPLLQIVTTKPDGLPFVKDVHIATTNCTTLSSDVVISWTTTPARSSAVEVEYHVILCVGSNASAHDCRNQSVKAPTSRVLFPGVKNFATLVAAVESLVKTENNIFEEPKVFSTGLSWAPDISGLNDLTVRDVTENSALVSWSKVQDFDKINGAYYNVVLIVRATQDATANGEFSGADSHAPQNGSVPNGQRIIVRNVTTSATSIELSNLKPWMNYTVAVTPTVVGEGQVFVGSSQSKDFTTLVGAPEKPRNVTVEESEDGHLLRWLPPNSWNGPPGGYEVSLTCTNREVKGNSTSVSLEPDRTALRIPKLSPGVPCTVSISAYTLFEGEPLDGARVRIRFTPLARKGEAGFEHPTIN